MSLYSLAASLFADMDKARASGGGRGEKGLRDEGRVTARSEGELLPRLTTSGEPYDDDADDAKQTTATIELLEGCLNDVQKVKLSDTKVNTAVPGIVSVCRVPPSNATIMIKSGCLVT